MNAPARSPVRMTVTEFLAWEPGDGLVWQLVEGEPRAMAPAKVTHGAIQARLSQLIGNRLEEAGGRCRLIVAPGIIPRADARHNVRVPDLAVSCSPSDGDDATLQDPVLIVEILSPSNEADTRANVRSYLTLASVEEVLVLETNRVGAEILRRRSDGSGPETPEIVTDGTLVLDSIGFAAPLIDIYRTTRLAVPRASG